MNSSPFLALGSAPKFSPTQLGTGIKLWLKADTGITQSGGLISAWADQSSNTNHATASSNKPTFVSSALGGLPTVRCVGPTQLTGANNVFSASAQRVTFIVMSNQQGGTTFTNVFTYRQATPFFSILWDVATGVYTDGANSARNQSIPSQTFAQSVVYEVGWDGDTTHVITVKLNGVSKTVTATGGAGVGPSSDTGTSGYFIHFSGQGAGDGGDISEIISCDTSVVTSTGLTLVRNYLGRKYGISIS